MNRKLLVRYTNYNFSSIMFSQWTSIYVILFKGMLTECCLSKSYPRAGLCIWTCIILNWSKDNPLHIGDNWETSVWFLGLKISLCTLNVMTISIIILKLPRVALSCVRCLKVCSIIKLIVCCDYYLERINQKLANRVKFWSHKAMQVYIFHNKSS